MGFTKTSAALVALVASLGAATASHAQEKFYAGKTINMIVPAGPGGSYGLYGLLLAKIMAQHIPGNPNIVLQFMPGAGGIRASNRVMSAPPDGTTMYLMHQNAVSQQLMTPAQVSYDAGAFKPIGIISSLNSVMVLRKDAPAKDIEGFKKTEVILGATGKGSYQFVIPTLMNQFQNTRFKLVTGYPGVGDLMLALERGEIHGMLSSLVAVQESRPDWITGKGIASLVFQVGPRADPAIASLPLLTSLARSDEELAIYRFMSADNGLGRSLVTTPNIPAEALSALRVGFDGLLKDPEFIKQSAERKLPTASSDHQALAGIIADVLATPPAVVEAASKLMKDQ